MFCPRVISNLAGLSVYGLASGTKKGDRSKIGTAARQFVGLWDGDDDPMIQAFVHGGSGVLDMTIDSLGEKNGNHWRTMFHYFIWDVISTWCAVALYIPKGLLDVVHRDG